MSTLPPSPSPSHPSRGTPSAIASPRLPFTVSSCPASSPPPSRRRRGAQPGNRNALKHGYYAGRFKRTDLNAYRSYRFAGVTEEIALLRLFIRRLVNLGVEDPNFSQSVNLLRVISLAVVSLDRLIKTQAHLIDGEDEISVAIREVFEELTASQPPQTPPQARHSPQDTSPCQAPTARQSGMDPQNENEPDDPAAPFQAYALSYNKDPDDTYP